jgi:hypothetical protein
MMVRGIPVEDAMEQLQLQVQVVQSRLRSDAASISGHVFESYDDYFQLMVASCIPDDWKYFMDMPALYSLVLPDGHHYEVMLEEEYSSSKSGYASSDQACLSWSFKTKVPGIFGAYRSEKKGNPFASILDYRKWESTGIKNGFRDQVEDGVTALESSLHHRMSVHTTHEVEAHWIFLTLVKSLGSGL